VELQDVIRRTGTCRYFLPDPLDDRVLRRLCDGARFASSGGNRQPVRYIAIRDAEVKRTLRDWYLEPWKAYMHATESGEVRVEGESARRLVRDADHMAEHLHEVPVLLVVCCVLADVTTPDARLERVGIAGGASVYPSVQNLLLTAREMGLGAALTTLLCAYEEEIRDLLGLPEGVAVAAVVALGWPERPLHRRLTRRPVEELLFSERYGEPLLVAADRSDAAELG
jgi:nitroreductase